MERETVIWSSSWVELSYISRVTDKLKWWWCDEWRLALRTTFGPVLRRQSFHGVIFFRQIWMLYGLFCVPTVILGDVTRPVHGVLGHSGGGFRSRLLPFWSCSLTQVFRWRSQKAEGGSIDDGVVLAADSGTLVLLVSMFWCWAGSFGFGWFWRRSPMVAQEVSRLRSGLVLVAGLVGCGCLASGFLTSGLLWLFIAVSDSLLIPEAYGGLHYAKVGCSLLRSMWSVFSCWRFLLVWKGLVSAMVFSMGDVSFLLHSRFNVPLWLSVGVG
ncbi:hypothetical protein L195_g008621 [Trifolium pratense]|uniref:Transmembrane protein n=1 Tax=Trifolium pratense TaxID=57577 RepID=A0A2K3P9P9_TRIPR|nr:hypothetical protein L195_g008621 [Trifolium pratense]